MSDPTSDEYVFECPDCGEHIEVNAGMREALLAHGCPICGTSVTEAAFSTPAQS
ncbi:MAG: zinc ribbon domain-containing protein [Haloferacaceae archaeon]